MLDNNSNWIFRCGRATNTLELTRLLVEHAVRVKPQRGLMFTTLLT